MGGGICQGPWLLAVASVRGRVTLWRVSEAVGGVICGAVFTAPDWPLSDSPAAVPVQFTPAWGPAGSADAVLVAGMCECPRSATCRVMVEAPETLHTFS